MKDKIIAVDPLAYRSGDVVGVSSMRVKSQVMPGTFCASTISANKGRVMVVLLLDETSPSEVPEFDVAAALKRMGWIRGV